MSVSGVVNFVECLDSLVKPFILWFGFYTFKLIISILLNWKFIQNTIMRCWVKITRFHHFWMNLLFQAVYETPDFWSGSVCLSVRQYQNKFFRFLQNGLTYIVGIWGVAPFWLNCWIFQCSRFSWCSNQSIFIWNICSTVRNIRSTGKFYPFSEWNKGIYCLILWIHFSE